MKNSFLKLLFSHKMTLLVALILIGFVLRFYNLNWGSPFYFHPDERNIASSISQLSFPDNFNPKFFAYGSLPLYLTFFLGLIPAFFSSCDLSFPCSITFEQAIILTRIISAIFAVLLIPLTFYIAEKLKKGLGIPAAVLTTFSTGFIQFAHFGTVELWLTFFTLLLFLLLLRSLTKPSIKLSIFSGVIMGILISTKVSSAPLFLLPLFTLLLRTHSSLPKKIIQTTAHLLFMILIASITFILTNPFVFLDTPSFINSIRYESGVALGTLPVFYTGEFFKTLPILFHFTSIYPFLINPFLTLLFMAAFVLLLPQILKKKPLILLYTFFLLTFLTQSFIFAKWTRYMLPTLPFMYLIITYWIDTFSSQKLRFLGIISIITLIFSLSYFITAFVENDTRIQASEFAQQSISPDAPILSEVYDLGITPFNSSHHAITLFNTYELDNQNPEYTPQTLNALLTQSKYIILPSQRILKTRLLNSQAFPLGNGFYQDLIDEKLGYKKIYQTPCSLFCQIVYLGDPLFQFEQTASVFDRPTIQIYQKL